MISVLFQGKPFNIMVMQAYTLSSNAEEAEVKWFYEDLQGLLELTPKKDDQMAQMASRYLDGSYLLKAARPPDSDLWLRDHPFRDFFIGGIRRTPSERENAGSPKSQSPSLSPLTNFLFLPDCLAHSLLCTRLTFWRWNPGGKIHCSWAVPSLDLAENLRRAPGRGSLFALLD